MEIILNGEKETLEREYTIVEILEKYEFKPEIVTVAVNGDIISKDDLTKTVIKDGDSVDILLFMGGGE